jgi:carbonic anhydrase
MAQVAGTSEAAVERLAITDPQISVAEDLDRLRGAPILPDDLVVAGYVYDVTDGHVREIVAPASLREGDGS